MAPSRDANDRRVVMARITDHGLRLLGELEESVTALHARQLGALGQRQSSTLRQLLQEIGGAREA